MHHDLHLRMVIQAQHTSTPTHTHTHDAQPGTPQHSAELSIRFGIWRTDGERSVVCERSFQSSFRRVLLRECAQADVHVVRRPRHPAFRRRGSKKLLRPSPALKFGARSFAQRLTVRSDSFATASPSTHTSHCIQRPLANPSGPIPGPGIFPPHYKAHETSYYNVVFSSGLLISCTLEHILA